MTRDCKCPDSSGWTTVKCCNDCGNSVEEFWKKPIGRWSIAKLGNEEAIMFDGCISAVSMNEIIDMLNERALYATQERKRVTEETISRIKDLLQEYYSGTPTWNLLRKLEEELKAKIKQP